MVSLINSYFHKFALFVRDIWLLSQWKEALSVYLLSILNKLA